LILSGFADLTEEVEDGLFDAGCDDALLGIRDGVPYLDFVRKATSLMEAVLSAIRDVENAGVGAKVVHVEPDDLASASEIAVRVGCSREHIRQLMRGTRGPGGFPPPVSGVTRKSRIWRWTEVANWLALKRDKVLVKPEKLRDAQDVAVVNAALDLLRLLPVEKAVRDLWRRLNTAERRRTARQARNDVRRGPHRA